MEFTKVHGTGNDFVLVDCRHETIKDFSAAAKEMCQRHFGIGADGLLAVLSPKEVDNNYQMRIFNSDGSEAEMCGNGIRCFAHYLVNNNLTEKEELRIETKAGIIKPRIISTKESKSQVQVNIGQPRFKPKQVPINIEESDLDFVDNYKIEVSGKEFTISCVSMGNPHTVIFVDTLEEVKLRKWGPTLETADLFPENTNVEFIEVAASDRIKMKVWERGVGVTLACGTGACGAAVVGIKKGLLEKEVTVELPGGELLISWSGTKEAPVKMTGPAETVFVGEYKGINL